MTRNWLCTLGAASCFVVAIACRSSDRSDRGPLSAAAVVGCYQFAHTDGRPLRAPSGFWAAPVHLDTTLALLDGDDGYDTEAGTFVVVPTGPLVASEAMDTALMRSTWQVLPPDTVAVVRSTGFTGQAIWLRPREGPDFAGVERWFSDVVDSSRPPEEDSVIARRVPCPPGG